ncbi:DUF6286 domain-containing protein [Jannaschia sp. R86511]|uniref:DUF6286 domain-containing protein n=1 Tax=Jannaschia sp. R86511 TaxID=3093853 RepID=UPI0036D21235
MTRRPRRIIPATLTALLLIALGAYAAVVSIGNLLGEEPTRTLTPLVDRASASPWEDPGVLTAGAVLLVLGLVLLLCGVMPGRAQVLALDVDPGSTRDNPTNDSFTNDSSTNDKPTGARNAGMAAGSTAGITRGSIHRAAQDAADGVDRVDSSQVTVTGRRVDVHTHASVRDTTGLAEQVEVAVTDRLANIPLSTTPRITVRATPARS